MLPRIKQSVRRKHPSRDGVSENQVFATTGGEPTAGGSELISYPSQQSEEARLSAFSQLLLQHLEKAKGKELQSPAQQHLPVGGVKRQKQAEKLTVSPARVDTARAAAAADRAVMQFVAETGQRPEVVESPAFRDLVQAISKVEASYTPPKAALLCPGGALLEAELKKARQLREKVLSSAEQTGLTLMLQEQPDNGALQVPTIYPLSCHVR